MIPRPSSLSARACETCLWSPRMLSLVSHRPLAGQAALSLERAAWRKPLRSASRECPQEVLQLSYWAAPTLMICLRRRSRPTSLPTAPTRTPATPSPSGPPRASTVLPVAPRRFASVWTMTQPGVRRGPPPANWRRARDRPPAARGPPRSCPRPLAAPPRSASAATTRTTCSPEGRRISLRASRATRPWRRDPLRASTGTSRRPRPTALRTAPTRTAGTGSRSGRLRGCSRPRVATPRSALAAARLLRPNRPPPTSTPVAPTRTPAT
mmetsp:Transcript_56604/g.160667  ORF Transcript_56604/g.160667 Transcript_56604/m.160667 type:complete len:267 (-) Transcript_56604:36-836(-)